MKEGTQTDHDNKAALYGLLRFQADFSKGSKDYISLDEYVQKAKEGQKKIYFVNAQSFEAGLSSPFY